MSRRNPAFPSAVGSVIPNIKRVCTVSGFQERRNLEAKSFILLAVKDINRFFLLISVIC